MFIYFDGDKLPTSGPNEFLWDFHEFNWYQDGTFIEWQGIGYHINRWKIDKGNYITEMHEELFYVDNSFMIRPIELIIITRK